MKKRADGLAAWGNVAAHNMLFNFLPRGFSIAALPEAGAMRIMPSGFPDGPATDYFCVRQREETVDNVDALKNRRHFLC